jgi:hypothetical protein
VTGPVPGPADVVLAQLAALQREPYEDGPDGCGEGLAEAWEYASPGNRAATGPLPRFARMLRADTYRGLLGHRAVQLGPLLVDGDEARVEVLVVTAEDRTQGYTWVLGREPAGRWLTEGVLRHPEAGG